jgi:hypothetical protein
MLFRTANNTMYVNSRYLPNQVIETVICNQTAINHSIFDLQLNQLNHDSKKLQSTQSTASKLIELIVDNSDSHNEGHKPSPIKQGFSPLQWEDLVAEIYKREGKLNLA